MGAPKFTAIDDTAALLLVANQVKAEPQLSLAAAIKATGVKDRATIRRLRSKFQSRREELMAFVTGNERPIGNVKQNTHIDRIRTTKMSPPRRQLALAGAAKASRNECAYERSHFSKSEEFMSQSTYIPAERRYHPAVTFRMPQDERMVEARPVPRPAPQQPPQAAKTPAAKPAEAPQASIKPPKAPDLSMALMAPWMKAAMELSKVGLHAQLTAYNQIMGMTPMGALVRQQAEFNKIAMATMMKMTPWGWMFRS